MRAFTEMDEVDNHSNSVRSPFKRIQEVRNLDQEVYRERIDEEDDKDFCNNQYVFAYF